MLLSAELESKNIIEVTYPLEKPVVDWIKSENWKAIDDYFLEAERPGGSLFIFLQQFLSFHSIEHIIAIRSAPDDEDGIWHDDGSRILGFTISLTEKNNEISGGHLCFKNKNEAEGISLPTRKLGQMLLFKTGIYGFEHMVTAVTNGRRIILAGWCS